MSDGALDRVRARGHIGIRLGLARMRALLARLDEPQRSMRGVLIAGTNGKGSVAAMVGSMCQAAGLRTSQAPSPHLSSYGERILVDGRPIDEADLDTLLAEVLEASEAAEARLGPATQFELLIAAAYLWSARQRVDVAVIEVGMGGRLDATSTWQPDVAAVTNVALDHQELLGDTIEAIAREKAAIIRRGSRAVTGASGPALSVIRRRARRLGVPLTECPPLAVEGMDAGGLWLGHERLGTLRLSLLGWHQAANAAVALGIVEALGVAGVASVDDEAVRRGLAATVWPGRLELLRDAGVTILLDGAHNPDGAAALAAAVDELTATLPQGRATLLIAVMGDKDVSGIAAALARSTRLRDAQVVTTLVPDSPRSAPPARLAQAWTSAAASDEAASAYDEAASAARIGPAPLVEADADAALGIALRSAAREGGPLVVAGSLYLLGYVRPRLVAGRQHR